MTTVDHYAALGRRHGERMAKLAMQECIGRGSAFREQWRLGYVDKLEAKTDAMMAAGVNSLDCLAFAKASWERMLEVFNETADKLEPAAAEARMNRKARRAAKAKGQTLQ